MNRQARPARSDPPASEPQQPEPVRLPPPSVTRDEVDLLIRRAGLTLNAGQKADLAVSFQHLVTLASKLPRSRPFADEPAFVFHPPLPAPGAAPTGQAEPARKSPAVPARPARAGKPAARPAAKGAKPKPVAKPAEKAKASKGTPAKPGAAKPGAAKARPAKAQATKRPARPARRR
jgi:nucleoid-associated protein YgaU